MSKKLIQQIIILVVILVAGSAVVSVLRHKPAPAQPVSEQPMNNQPGIDKLAPLPTVVTGRVIKVSSSEIQIQTFDSVLYTLKINSKTKYQIQGQAPSGALSVSPAKFSDIHINSRVMVPKPGNQMAGTLQPSYIQIVPNQ